MHREGIDSSNLAAIGRDARKQTPGVYFESGGIYQCFDVPERTYQDLRQADSPGGYLNREIRGQYRYAKV